MQTQVASMYIGSVGSLEESNMKSPQQQIYDAVFLLSMNLGYDTYNKLPSDGVSYPFVYIGEQLSDDAVNKSTVTGLVTQYIRVYNNSDRRRETTDIVNNLIREIRKLRHTDTFYISVRRVHQQVMIETITPSQPLVGHIEIDFKFN